MGNGMVLYHEPTILTILTLSAFTLALNIVEFILDKAIYCGLVGQILMGMAFGSPGADILGLGLQQVIADMGYLGLILLVFEGGLSTNLHGLLQNLILSMAVACTGILLPIAISFLLVQICDTTILQAFAAGCALSSTSLGTTFTILKSSGLNDSRLGVVLTSAAMLDDVVGLVLVQVISNLGSSADGDLTLSIVRPVFVSIAFAVLVAVVMFFMKGLAGRYSSYSQQRDRILKLCMSRRGDFVLQTTLLLSAIACAAYAGTSVLFAAYLAGLLISGTGGNGNKSKTSTKRAHNAGTSNVMAKVSRSAVMERRTEAWEMLPSRGNGLESPEIQGANKRASHAAQRKQPSEQEPKANFVDTGCQTEPNDLGHKPGVYKIYYAGVVDRILKPFFFGSIGFSIPITKLFNPPTLWRGVVYAVMMAIAKLACGLWLIRLSKPPPTKNPSSSTIRRMWKDLIQYRSQSLYPASLLGNAMVARGEIGFLISAIAQSNGIFERTGGQGDLFLVVTWAILLCTIVGPVVVGILTRRVKRIRNDTEDITNGKDDPLGVWADIKQ